MPSGISAEFEWIDEDLESAFANITERWPQHRTAVLDALGEELAGNIRRDIPTSSGAAKSTVRVIDTEGDSPGRVMAGGKRGVDYIEPLLEGSRPHAPGSPRAANNPSLARWARRNNYPGGFESIYWSIYHYGTEAHDFLTEPLADAQEEAGTIAAAVMRRRGVLER